MKKKNTKKTSAGSDAQKPSVPSLQLPQGWYLMATREFTVEDIRDCLEDGLYEIEIWKDAGVLEVVLAEKASLDIEACDLDLGDQSSNEFLAEHSVQSLFYLSFPEEVYEKAEACIRQILAVCGGAACGDTYDFTPMILPDQEL